MVSFEYDVLASCLSFSISRRQTFFTLISIKEYISSTLGLSWPLARTFDLRKRCVGFDCLLA